MDCVFCGIIAGEIPCAKVFESESVLAFKDIAPQAPVHIVFIPKNHDITSMDGITGANSAVVAEIFAAIAQVAREQGLDAGYRVVCNCGEHGGQTVGHLHFHLLGGRKLGVGMV